ncbi:glycosyltransferase [Novosphingobium aerophilum]|uniref:glycosyltransferase n=1 Tax=Novosphingobium aerophilum TaxID=2839843 RepID=UPI001639AEE7
MPDIAMTASPNPSPGLGVVIVSYNSSDVILECLDSLAAAGDSVSRIVVVDNQSSDQTVALIRAWANGTQDYPQPAESPLARYPAPTKPVPLVEIGPGELPAASARLTVIRSPVNRGFAGGVNLGLDELRRDPAIDLFWVLNPDCVVPPETPRAILTAGTDPDFALMGGRTIHYEQPESIQSDGGRVSRLTGRCHSLNAGAPPGETAMPTADVLDFISGASMIASRRMLEEVGLMAEEYFLYYEEVDWARRRGSLPLRVAPEVVVYHRGGTAIGSGSISRRASPFANYFNYRNRQWFVRRFMPDRMPLTWGLGLMKAMQLLVRGAPAEAWAIIAGTFGLGPPRAIRARVSDPTTAGLAFSLPRPGPGKPPKT